MWWSSEEGLIHCCLSVWNSCPCLHSYHSSAAQQSCLHHLFHHLIRYIILSPLLLSGPVASSNTLMLLKRDYYSCHMSVLRWSGNNLFDSYFCCLRRIRGHFPDSSFSTTFSTPGAQQEFASTVVRSCQVKGWGSRHLFGPFGVVHPWHTTETFFPEREIAILSNCQCPLFFPQPSAWLLSCPCLFCSTLPS